MRIFAAGAVIGAMCVAAPAQATVTLDWSFSGFQGSYSGKIFNVGDDGDASHSYATVLSSAFPVPSNQLPYSGGFNSNSKWSVFSNGQVNDAGVEYLGQTTTLILSRGSTNSPSNPGGFIVSEGSSSFNVDGGSAPATFSFANFGPGAPRRLAGVGYLPVWRRSARWL